MKPDAADILTLAGFLSFVGGIAAVSPAGASIVAGVLLMATGVRLAQRR